MSPRNRKSDVKEKEDVGAAGPDEALAAIHALSTAEEALPAIVAALEKWPDDQGLLDAKARADELLASRNGQSDASEIPDDLSELNDDELRELAAKHEIDVDPFDREAVEAQLKEVAVDEEEAEPAAGDGTPNEAELEPPRVPGPGTEIDASGRQVAAEPSGATKTVTYLGRPETIHAPANEADPLDEDVYGGLDPWNGGQPVTLAVGESTQVSAEKATQLEHDFPGAFEIS